MQSEKINFQALVKDGSGFGCPHVSRGLVPPLWGQEGNTQHCVERVLESPRRVGVESRLALMDCGGWARVDGLDVGWAWAIGSTLGKNQ